MSVENKHIEPIVSAVGLIAADVETAADCYQQWQNDILKNYGMNVLATKDRKTVSEAHEYLLPFTTPIRTRFIFLGTRSKWSVFLDNGRLGTDAASTMPVIAEMLNCETVRVVNARQTLPSKPDKNSKGKFGATILEVYSVDGSVRRCIYALNDGGTWKFDQGGVPYPFEDQDSYSRRLVRDRFTAAMLADYLANLDAYPFEESWYNGEAVLMRKEGALPANMVEYNSTS